MKPSTFQEFVAFARMDAAIQERVAEALKGSQPVNDIIAIAADSGHALAHDEVTAALDGALGDHDLETVAGGFRAPTEWFAEGLIQKKIPKTID
jgi:hypothetical protein